MNYLVNVFCDVICDICSTIGQFPLYLYVNCSTLFAVLLGGIVVTAIHVDIDHCAAFTTAMPEPWYRIQS